MLRGRSYRASFTVAAADAQPHPSSPGTFVPAMPYCSVLFRGFNGGLRPGPCIGSESISKPHGSSRVESGRVGSGGITRCVRIVADHRVGPGGFSAVSRVMRCSKSRGSAGRISRFFKVSRVARPASKDQGREKLCFVSLFVRNGPKWLTSLEASSTLMFLCHLPLDVDISLPPPPRR